MIQEIAMTAWRAVFEHERDAQAAACEETRKAKFAESLLSMAEVGNELEKWVG